MTDNDGTMPQQEQRSPSQTQSEEQQRQTPSSPSGEGGTNHLGGIDDPPSLSQNCMSIVRSFKWGEKAKVITLLKIQAILATANLSQESLAQSFLLYLKFLNSIENQKSRAAEQGGNQGPDTVTAS